MRLASVLALSSSLLFACVTPMMALPRAHRGPTAPRLASKHAVKPVPKPQTQHAIDSERAAQIQTALIKSGYLNGSPTGVWDAQTSAAMEKLQADNGWQTKFVPDARGLIKLGLGPNSSSPASAAETSASSSSESKPVFSHQ